MRPSISKWMLQPLAAALCFAVAQAQTLPPRLDIEVIQGEGAVNQARQRATTLPAVRVVDSDRRPIAGAVAVFTVPSEGASGDFNGEQTAVVTTDANGVAAVKAFRLNGIPGKVPIHVSASYRGLSARTVINQESVLRPGEKPDRRARGGHGALIAVLLCAAGAAGGAAAYLATQGKSQAGSTPSTPVVTPIGITPGTGSISGGYR